jgi:cholesterol oxidase
MAFDYDVLVIGSGFGGSVTALRLTEKGYRVGVLEAGQRWTDETLPKTSWDLKNYVWNPKAGLRGIQRVDLLSDVVIVSGAGVGGGSLVYANTLYEPLPPFYTDKQWGHITDWRSELAPHYDQAKRMLGVVENPLETAADGVMREIAEEMGRGHTFHKTPVGVYFGEAGKKASDPYFGGAGPERSGCTECGACMTGCRYNAKNRLDKNYLYLAEKAGATVHPETEVRDIRPLGRATGSNGSAGTSPGYAVATAEPGKKRVTRTFTAEHVVVSAGALGSQKLLHRLKDEGSLPRLSDRLGSRTRTNSEAILGAQARTTDVDYSRGIAITSSFHPSDDTHIEPVRYGKGDNAMGLMSTLMTDDDGRMPRQLKFLLQVLLHPIMFLRSLSVRRWSERTIIVLVMQTLDNSIKVSRKKRPFSRKFGELRSAVDSGEPNPTWIPVGNQVTRRIAEKIGGYPGGTWGEALLNVPMTAHIIGGATIGDSAATGVIDPYHRAYGHPGLHIVDGSSVTANLGVNPSLTITAMAERAMSFWPNKGEADTRPALDAAYQRLAPVAPQQPVVPSGAPGALLLPMPMVRSEAPAKAPVQAAQGQAEAGEAASVGRPTAAARS